jgi:hypothetical protein
MRAAQRGLDAGQQLGQGEGLGHVVVGAQLERCDLVVFVLAGGEHDDRDVIAGRADLLEHPQPALAWQRDVEQDQSGGPAGDLSEGGLAVVDDLGSVALQLEVQGQPLGDGRVVLDDSHQRAGSDLAHAASR